jgi:hypothetical protein
VRGASDPTADSVGYRSVEIRTLSPFPSGRHIFAITHSLQRVARSQRAALHPDNRLFFLVGRRRANDLQKGKEERRQWGGSRSLSFKISFLYQLIEQ